MIRPVSLLLFLSLVLPLSGAETRGDTPIVIKPGVMTFPRSAAIRSIDEGWATVAIEVDAEGALSDYLVTGYSYPVFGSAAEMLIRNAQYEPATDDGRPIAVRMEVPIEFKTSGIRINSDWDAIVELYLHTNRVTDQSYRIAGMADLDRIPVPLHIVDPTYSHEMAADGIIGSATIDFYIDHDGAVRMPAIADSEHVELGQIALAAVKEWLFESPTREGKTVAVRAIQEFRFSEAQGAAVSAASGGGSGAQ